MYVSFLLLFLFPDKAIVNNLTLNDTSEALTVAAEDHVTVPLVCQTFGRPQPTDVKLTKVDNDSFADAHMAQVSNTGRWRSESTVTLSDVQCSDMGTYVCTASNGVGPADSMNVVLNVRCECCLMLYSTRYTGTPSYTICRMPQQSTV